ncbi:hypothetical protein EDD86DRAFT_201420 [Gorgonomyces haynaldii]|nr:hypothetical protein EDD86DRAFT_201420 [Gorgonomyces haynaldii]
MSHEKELPPIRHSLPPGIQVSIDTDRVQRIAELIRQHKEKFVDRNTGVAKIPMRSFTSRDTKPDPTPYRNSIIGFAGEVSQMSLKSQDIKPIKLQSVQSQTIADKPYKLSEQDTTVLGRDLFNGRVPNISRDMVSSIIGKGGEFYNQVLVSYMDCFEFHQLNLDDAFRRLCEKLYLSGETQMVDRILYQFSRRYWECNRQFDSLYRSVDIVYGILFSLVLLNTDLHIVNIGPNQSKKMPLKTFIKNTMELVDTMIEKDEKIQSDVVDNPISFKKWKRDLEQYLKNLYQNVQNEPILLQQEEIKSHSTSSLTPSPTKNFARSPSSLSTKTVFKSLHRSTRSVSDGLSITKEATNVLACHLEGILIRKHTMEQDQKARYRRWNKLWTQLRLHEHNNLELAMYRVISKTSERDFDPPEHVSEPFFSFHVQELSCRIPDEDMIQAGQESLVPIHPVYASREQPYKISGEEETLVLVHAFAIRVENEKRENVFSLHLSNGNSYMFQAPSIEALDQWIMTINYWAGRNSRQPMRGGMSSGDYGWSNLTDEPKRSIEQESRLSFTLRRKEKPKLLSWTPPTTSSRLVSESPESVQLETMFKQVEIVLKEIKEHEQVYDKMIALYEDYPSAQQQAKTNWKRKHDYLQMELAKYQCYCMALADPPMKRYFQKQVMQSPTPETIH